MANYGGCLQHLTTNFDKPAVGFYYVQSGRLTRRPFIDGFQGFPGYQPVVLYYGEHRGYTVHLLIFSILDVNEARDLLRLFGNPFVSSGGSPR